MVTKKDKKTKGPRKAPRKAQPLPRSVQALLKYLGGTDVKMGGARGGQPAQLAPTAINIAVSQQQQQQQTQTQQQAQQYMSQRFAPKGQIIGKSPLSAVVPQQPVIVPQAPASAETERKILAQEKQAEFNQGVLNRKLGLLEASQQQFRQAAAAAYQDIKTDISRRVAGDANIFDARNVAARFTPRPVIEESQFAGMSFGEAAGAAAAARESNIMQGFRGAVQEVEAEGLGEHLAGQYVQNVSSPEMTAIERPKKGRPRKSEAEKLVTKAAAAQRRKAARLSGVEATSSAQLLEGMQSSGLAGFKAPESRMPVAAGGGGGAAVKRAPVQIQLGAPDMATQIALLMRGGGAAAEASRGSSIAELMGMRVIKKISPGNK